MTDTIEQEMRATYSASKRWWRGVIVLWAAATILAVVTQVPMPKPTPVITAVVSFLLAIGTFAVRWRAEALYQTAEGLRRAQLISDGLGEAGDPAELARLRASASDRVSDEPPPIGPYYSSERAKGWQRVIHNVQESAFYTEALARRSALLCALAVVAILATAIVVLVCAASMTSTADVAGVLGQVAIAAVAATTGGTLADLARAYFALSRGAAAACDRARALLNGGDLTIRYALEAADAYNAALVGVPPIPAFVYRSLQARLDVLWKDARAARAPDSRSN